MLHYKELANNRVKITADSGQIKDVRVGTVYSEVVCKEQQKKYFAEVNGS